MIEPFEQAAVIAAEDDVGIFRMRLHPSRFAPGGLLPISEGDAGAGRAAGYLDSRVVLLRAVDVVGEIVVERDSIELRRRLILLRPGSAAVEGDVSASVVGVYHPARIIGRDP